MSVVCQACLAHYGFDHQPAQTSESSHCSDKAEHGPAGYNTGEACECDGVAAGIKTGAHKEMFNFNPVALVHGFGWTRRAEDPDSYPVNALSPGYPGLSPIGSYRVQIK